MKLDKMIDDAKAGKSLFETINNFVFLQGGARDVVVNDNVVGHDIPVNQYAFDAEIPAVAPTIAATNGILSVSLIEQGGCSSQQI
ncbi:MAG: hypothetical protein R2827_04885 [Bdellovibrionales bacterium]